MIAGSGMKNTEATELMRIVRSAVRDGVKDALVELKIVEELQHPITGGMLPTKILARFIEREKSRK